MTNKTIVAEKLFKISDLTTEEVKYILSNLPDSGENGSQFVPQKLGRGKNLLESCGITHEQYNNLCIKLAKYPQEYHTKEDLAEYALKECSEAEKLFIFILGVSDLFDSGKGLIANQLVEEIMTRWQIHLDLGQKKP